MQRGWNWLLSPQARGAGEHIRLRQWFYSYTAWLGSLTLVACVALRRFELGDVVAQRVWLWALTLFYLSLCCVFFPLPTSWIVMLLASNQMALVESVPLRVVLIATSCALATAAANLNEYHIFTFLLRYGRVARVRNLTAYQWAANWFGQAPFAVLLLFSFLPIPVDVARWLAIATGYPRRRYFCAYFVGRGVRYALLAASTIWLDLSWWTILLIQAGLILVFASKAAVAFWRRRRGAPDDRLAPAPAVT
ncbi:MAG TPA: hypothetical protein VGM03_00815 [Phycisphaerae bacterium]|jgi:membrane protein YqaA with SNARE-associated domain